MTTHSLVDVATRLANDFASGASLRDKERQLPHVQMQALADHGVLAGRVPKTHGGQGISILDLVRIYTQIAKADPNIAQAIQPHACGIEKLRLYGTPEQQRYYFNLIRQGALITNATAEKGGKYIGEIKTAITQTNDGSWRLNGEKNYCTGSLFASHFYAVVKRDDNQRSIVIFPRNRAGVEVLDDWDGMGQRTTASGTVRLHDVHIAGSEHIPLPPSGAVRTYEGAFAQILHAAIDAGIALAAFEDAAWYGREKARPMPEANVVRASDDPYVQQVVGEMAVLVHGAEALVERAAQFVDDAIERPLLGEASETQLGYASVVVAEAKMAANDASLRVSEMLYRVGGAGATIRALNFDRHWRNARTHTTHDPVIYKAKAVGDFYLNDRLPAINTKI